ncbi:hypothetical protein P4O66_003356 [Electrophorus voltai]|uniref:Tc1-like transposase DDE domain-containing protein n=1 Tax=Electrophorus voltai TaxID=2609070 RepID=A0AAD8YRS7_9TELE|nr:hypothetical protein P4O66_003356 [Electrophorus voltai]
MNRAICSFLNPRKWTTTLSTKEWLRDNSVNVLEWSSQSPDLNPIEHLWRDLKMAVPQCSPSNLMELERFCKEEWEKLPKNSYGGSKIPFICNGPRSIIKAWNLPQSQEHPRGSLPQRLWADPSSLVSESAEVKRLGLQLCSLEIRIAPPNRALSEHNYVIGDWDLLVIKSDLAGYHRPQNLKDLCSVKRLNPYQAHWTKTATADPSSNGVFAEGPFDLLSYIVEAYDSKC